ncbi:MAG: 3-dehydroquinate synthase family protein, partial [Planctomycetota bacterium]
MTQRIAVATRVPYEVVVGRGALGELGSALAGSSAVAVLSDENVLRAQGGRLGTLAGAPRLALAPGEGSKSFATLERVLDFLLAAGLDRGSKLVAFGGGVVGDVGGLAAALFQRGIGVVQAPTSLLAQVDSSVGGKTAVNLAAGKNLAGVFHQPSAVLADTDTLATLPDEELAAGLGEVVKTALVGDPALLELLERSSEALRARDGELLGEVVARCVTVKARIVSVDEDETQGVRKFLNLGHTFGHGIEQAAGPGTIPHGVAVAVGLVLALEASRRLGRLQDPALLERIPRLLTLLGLPASLAELRTRYRQALAPAALVAGMRHDKKGAAGTPRFVLV